MKFIIATHGKMASGIKDTVEMLTGKKDNLYAVDAYVDDQEFAETFARTLASFDDPYIYVFTDIVSGSVNQAVSALLDNGRLHLVTGVNLPVIMELVLRNEELSDEEIGAVIEEAKGHLIYMNGMCQR